MAEYPEHAKLVELEEKRAIIQNFLDFLLDDEQYTLCRWVHSSDGRGPGYESARVSREAIMGRFLGVDPRKLEAEKRHMLKRLQEVHDDPM